MTNKCPPKEVLKKCKLGADKVSYKDPKWNQGFKGIGREGKEIITEYGCGDISKECL